MCIQMPMQSKARNASDHRETFRPLGAIANSIALQMLYNDDEMLNSQAKAS
jgi:hypothetical protein